MDRRSFLKSFVTASTVAVAAHLGVTSSVASEVQQEMAKDLRRQVFGMPQHTLTEQRSVWFSVANVADVWADQLLPELEALGFSDRESRMRAMCATMARKLDFDLKTAGVTEDQKVLVELPRVRRAKLDKSFGYRPTKLKDTFELVAGVEQQSGLFGDRTRIGYIQEKIIVPGE